jgi:hypothetical protein
MTLNGPEQTLLRRRERLIVVPQNFYEFSAVATRPPARRPLGFREEDGVGRPRLSKRSSR